MCVPNFYTSLEIEHRNAAFLIKISYFALNVYTYNFKQYIALWLNSLPYFYILNTHTHNQTRRAEHECEIATCIER